MEVTTIQAAERSERGRNQVERLREQGRIPVVVYGQGKEPAHLSVDEFAMEQELRHHHRVFHLAQGGQQEAVYLQEVQFDTVTDRCLHLDFLRIDLEKPMPVEVELRFLGVPKGNSRGGAMITDRSALPVLSLPAAIPHEIEVRVTEVDLGDAILAKDLKLPGGVTLNVPEDTQICHMPG